MQKKLTHSGNSLALVLDRALLDQTGIDAETPLEISTDGEVIVDLAGPERAADRQAAAGHGEGAREVRRRVQEARGVKDPEFLTLDEVLALHADRIARYGGSEGIRDVGLLKSALAAPAATFDGGYLHPTLPEMAAAYLFHLVKNHPFVDGNERVGLARRDRVPGAQRPLARGSSRRARRPRGRGGGGARGELEIAVFVKEHLAEG